jgi:hypothetical protein
MQKYRWANSISIIVPELQSTKQRHAELNQNKILTRKRVHSERERERERKRERERTEKERETERERADR